MMIRRKSPHEHRRHHPVAAHKKTDIACPLPWCSRRPAIVPPKLAIVTAANIPEEIGVPEILQGF
jgi:hypothetical protein